MRRDLSGCSSVNPIQFSSMSLYCDSLVSLSWLNAAVYKLDKMQKKSPFVINRLAKVCSLCELCEEYVMSFLVVIILPTVLLGV